MCKSSCRRAHSCVWSCLVTLPATQADQHVCMPLPDSPTFRIVLVSESSSVPLCALTSRSLWAQQIFPDMRAFLRNPPRFFSVKRIHVDMHMIFHQANLLNLTTSQCASGCLATRRHGRGPKQNGKIVTR